MAKYHLSRKTKSSLIVTSVSVLAIIFLIRSVDWKESIRIFNAGMSPGALLSFVALAIAIAGIYGYRWRILLDREIRHKPSFVASILCLGGNMFLPARGGDLLRIHYSHVEAKIPNADLIIRMVIEKIIDLLTIMMVGLLAIRLLDGLTLDTTPTLLNMLTLGVTIAITMIMVLIRYFTSHVLSGLSAIFRAVDKIEFFKTYIEYFVNGIRYRLTLSVMSLPIALTMAMWLLLYAPFYMLIAQLVGVPLSYRESLLVLFAGALGLMLPAAPSGIGTFHASVVSAFLILGRTAAEGLLVGTAIHFLSILAYALPAGIVYGRWHLARKISN